MQGRLQRGQCDVYNRAVNERHTRTENRRGQNPEAVCYGGGLARAGQNCGFVARRSGDAAHSPFSTRTWTAHLVRPNVLRKGRRVQPYCLLKLICGCVVRSESGSDLLIHWLEERAQHTCDLFRGDFLLRTASNCAADAGARTARWSTMSLAGSFFRYSFSLASLSGRSVEPSSETPANNPRDRE